MSVEQQGAHEGGGRNWGVGAPPTSCPPLTCLHVGPKSPEFVFDEKITFLKVSFRLDSV